MDNSYKPDSILKFEKEHGITLENRTAEGSFYLPSNSFRLDESGDVVALKIQGIKSLNKICLFLSLEELDISNSSISKIEGLETLINLRYLDLSGTSITGVAGLETLIDLRYLDLSGTSITGVVGLETLINLRYLDLSGTSITGVTGLETLINLTRLNLSRALITDVSGLGILTNLRYLDLSGTSIIDVSGLGALIDLRYLDLSGTLITDVSGLGTLINLTSLDLSRTSIIDVSGLGTLINLTSLNLSRTSISEATGLRTLINLTSLDLSRTSITDLSGLETLINLTSLDLSRTSTTDVSGLGILINLTSLDLLRTSITDVSELGTLINLRRLNLSRTSITDVSGLGTLINLRRLNLSRTSITDVSGLGTLINLTSLDLSRTSITDVSGLGILINLTSLDLSRTSITDVSGLGTLINLTSLDLSWTSIFDVSGLGVLINLRRLNLSRTSITDVSGLETLINLRRLNLSRTSITDVSGLGALINLMGLDLSMAKIKGIKGCDINHLVRLERLYIDSNPFLHDNDIILPRYRNHKDDILNLIEEQKEEKVSFEYPYKVMLLGNHGAGKSSFLKHYDSEYQFEGSTHILQIFKSSKNGSPKVIFYDFGGQDYYHGIYQTFFTNEALNLLFWHDKTNHNKRAKDRDGVNILNFNRQYWLSQIRYASHRKTQSYQRSKNDTFVIQTHADIDRQKTLGTISMGKEPTSLVNEEFFVALDYDKTTAPTLEEKEGYLHAVRYLKSRLKSAVTLKNGKKLYPESQIKLYNEIQEVQKTIGYKCLNISELLKGYTKSLLKAKLYQLYRKGEVLYYRWSEELEDVVWLNPAETVRYIHTILSKENMTEEKGRISEEKMKNSFDKDPKLLRLLSLEKVVFHDEKKKTYIIPGYLPLAEEDEAYSWLTLGFMTPNFTLKFESFIPFGLINQLICYYGSGENELKRYWRDQLIFTLRNEYMIWIALDFEYLMIKVYINPLPNGSKEKIAQLEQEIFFDLFCFYWDRIPLQGRIEEFSSRYFDFLSPEDQAIEREIPKRIWDEIFSEKRESPITDLYLSVYDPNLKAEDQLYVHLETLDDPEKTKSKIMGYPLTADGQIDKDRGQTLSTKRYKHLSANPELKSVKQIFISYSKADREDLMELNKFLEDLKREEKIEVYYDERTTPGDMIHEVIRQKIIEADYVIALVSQDYISTEYIRDVELPLIKEKNKRLIPIIIKPCTWTMNEISNHYATLKGTEISFPDWNKDSHPGNYEACRAQNWTRAVTEISQKIFNNKDN